MKKENPFKQLFNIVNCNLIIIIEIDKNYY